VCHLSHELHLSLARVTLNTHKACSLPLLFKPFCEPSVRSSAKHLFFIDVRLLSRSDPKPAMPGHVTEPQEEYVRSRGRRLMDRIPRISLRYTSDSPSTSTSADWLNRLPRIASVSRSQAKSDSDGEEIQSGDPDSGPLPSASILSPRRDRHSHVTAADSGFLPPIEARENVEKDKTVDEAESAKEDTGSYDSGLKNMRRKLGAWRTRDELVGEGQEKSIRRPSKGPALAYQFGNTVSLFELQ
jgi:hypothetical protein